MAIINFSFFARLFNFSPTYSRNQIAISADKTYENIDRFTLPVMRSAGDTFQGQKFVNKKSTQYCSGIIKAVGSKNAFASIAQCMEKTLQILEYCNEQSVKIFNATEATQGMTFAKFTLLRTIQMGEFASEYSRKFLNYVLAEEALASGVSDVGVSKKEAQWIDDNFEDFCIALSALDRDVDGFKAHIENLPDAIITEATERTFSTTIGESKYDPMNMRNFSVEFNPFYFVGMLRANWQERRYEAAEQDLVTIQMRVLHLQRLKEKSNDAKLEKQIQYHQERVTKLTQEIEEMKRNWKLEV